MGCSSAAWARISRWLLPAAAVAGIAASAPSAAAGITYEATVLADGPVGYWRFEETTALDPVADSAPAGGAQDGAYGGTAALDPLGRVGQAMRVTPGGGTGGFADVPVPITASFTAEAWVKSATASYNANGWMPNRRSANGFFMHPNENSTAFRGFVVSSSGGSSQVAQVGVENIQLWHHYVVTYDDATKTGRVLIDGIEMGSSTFPGLVRDPSADISVSIGRDTYSPGSADRQGDGWLDEVAVYQSPLAADALERHFLVGISPDWYDAGLRRFAGPGDLDLDGQMVYAVALGDGSAATLGTIRDATFTGEGVAGVSVSADSALGAWGTRPDYGPTAEDDVLATAMHSVRYDSGANATLDRVDVGLSVIPSATYKVQMLFSENDPNVLPGQRLFDVAVEETGLSFDEFDARYAQGPTVGGAPTRGIVVTQEAYASDPQLNLSVLRGSTGTNQDPILGGVTLELLHNPVFHGPEDLDFFGDFVYAIDAGVNSGDTIGRIGDAVFTGEQTPGATVLAERRLATWNPRPEYGDSSEANVLEALMHSIAYDSKTDTTMPGVEVSLQVEPGQKYLLQLLFSENANTTRSFDIEVEGELLIDEYQIKLITQQTGGVPTAGAVFSHAFFAEDDLFTFRLLNGSSLGNGDPILNAFTLQIVPEPSSLVLLGLGALGLAPLRRRGRGRRSPDLRSKTRRLNCVA